MTTHPDLLTNLQLGAINLLAARCYSRSSRDEDIKRKFGKPKEQLTTREASKFIHELRGLLARPENRSLNRLYFKD